MKTIQNGSARAMVKTGASALAMMALVAGAAVPIAFTAPQAALAQGQGSGGQGSGGQGSGGEQGSGGSDSGQSGGGGSDSGQRGSGGNSDGEGRVIEAEDDDGDGRPEWSGESGGNPDRGSDTTSGGGRPEGTGGRPDDVGGGDEDSDRPDWAGVPGGSAGRGSPPDAGGGGDLYGDLYVILRDPQGVPILSDAGFVQPIDSEGNLIPLDEDGHPLDETLVQEVEIGRLNVSRAPDDVLEGRSEEVLDVLNSATAYSFDAAGRLVLTIDGEEKTIDAPLENLSIYIALMTTGTIEGVDNPALGDLFLVDGVQDAEDLLGATSFLAGATDKSGELTLDDVAYVNLILGLNTSTIEGSEVNYSAIDYTTFTYDREDRFDTTVTVLVEQADGSWVPQEVNVYDTVFDGANDTTVDGTLEAFTQASDDARAVVEFIHEYEVPVSLEDL